MSNKERLGSQDFEQIKNSATHPNVTIETIPLDKISSAS